MKTLHSQGRNSLREKLQLAYQRRRGAMLILIAFLLVVMLMMVTFSVDVAYMQLARTELRAATDAAARAASETLARTQDPASAKQAAKLIARKNRVAGSPLKLRNKDIVFGRTTFNNGSKWAFTPGGQPYNAVKIYGKRTDDSKSGAVNLFFASMYDNPTFETETSAVASNLDRDIAVVVDRSGSMNWNSRWAGLKNAVNVFVRELRNTPQTEMISLAVYSSSSSREVELTNNPGAISSALAQMNPSGMTNIGGGLDDGSYSLVNDALARPLAAKTVVLMTDGYHNTGTSPITAANRSKALGHTVHTITFGAGANASLMRQVADITGGRYYHADDNEELAEVFKEIALTLPVVMSQ